MATDFLRGVLSALAIYLVWRFVEHSRARIAETELEVPSLSTALRASIEEAKQRPRAVVNGHHAHGVERRKWLAHIRQPALMARSAFVHHQASVIGRVVLGDSVHIAAGASVRADEGSPFYIGANTNIQDGVVIHALQDRYVMVGGGSWAVYIGKNVSIAHDAWSMVPATSATRPSSASRRWCTTRWWARAASSASAPSSPAWSCRP
ncbi:hypothetical protein, partial [Methylogaea oryzae]|uniref:hypothetical protein n=1 Tax=Methylogaea oryzae TaxID=1295382 RepID=UPI00402BA024